MSPQGLTQFIAKLKYQLNVGVNRIFIFNADKITNDKRIKVFQQITYF